MKVALLILLTTVSLSSNIAFASGASRSALLGQIQEIDGELATFEHESRGLSIAQRVLFYTSLFTSRRVCRVPFVRSADDLSLIETLDCISQGVENKRYNWRLSRLISRKLNIALSALAQYRIEEEEPVLTVDVSFEGPSEFNFGTILIFDTAFNTFVLTNSGTTDVTLTEVGTLSGEPFRRSSFSDCIVGSVLQPGQSCEAEVQFAPEATITFSETLTIRFTDGQTDGEASVDIVGSAMPRN